MFTGIVEEIGRATSVASRGLTIEASRVLEDVKVGDSIAVNGVCLTVVSFSHRAFTVGLMPETLRRSNLGHLRPGDSVNLERALAAGSRLGGHFVQGHVDGLGKVVSLSPEGEAVIVRLEAPPEIMRYVVAKGFIAVDGVSLTVVDCDSTGFSVSLVRFTQEAITLPRKKPDYQANIEVDILGKYVERFVSVHAASNRSGDSALTEGFLAEHGFL